MFRQICGRKKTTSRPVKYEDSLAGSIGSFTHRLSKLRRYSEELFLFVLAIIRALQGPGAPQGQQSRAWQPGAIPPPQPWSRAGQGQPVTASAADIRHVAGNGPSKRKEDC